MPSATDFLPSSMTEFMNLESTWSPNLGSGRISRFSGRRRRDIDRVPFSSAWSGTCPGLTRACLFGALDAVFRAGLATVLDPLGVEHAPEDVVADTGEVADAAAADQDHRVLLEIVAFAGDVADHLALVGQADLGDLAKRRVRLLRRGRVDAGADAALLRVLLHRGNLALRLLRLPTLADQLVDRRHEAFTSSSYFAACEKRKSPGGLTAPQAFGACSNVQALRPSQDSVWSVRPPPAPGRGGL